MRSRIAALWFLLLHGCGSATLGIFGSNGDDDEPSPSSLPSVEGVAVRDLLITDGAERAILRFKLADREGDRVDVGVLYYLPAGGMNGSAPDFTRPFEVTRFIGDSNLSRLQTASGDGIEHVRTWDYGAELDDFLSDRGTGRHVNGMRLEVRLLGKNPPILDRTDEDVELGNDPASILSVQLPDMDGDGVADEVSGTVPVAIDFEETNHAEKVAVMVEYDVVGDDPDLGFSLVAASDSRGFIGSVDQVEEADPPVEFLWDSNQDFPGQEKDLILRVTAADPFIADQLLGDTDFRETHGLVSPVIAIDNNQVPIATIDQDSYRLSPDSRRGIAVQFELSDGDSLQSPLPDVPIDHVRIVAQWSRDGSFGDLPYSRAAIEALLQDPVQRESLRIADLLAADFRGIAKRASDGSGGVAADRVRLPELKLAASVLNHSDIIGQRLDVLRRTRAPAVLSWPSDPLDSILVALPIGAGPRAVVIDFDASRYRLLEIDTTVGSILRTIATVAAEPIAACLEPCGQSVLVVERSSPSWLVARIDLQNGQRTSLIADDGSFAGDVRAITSAGRRSFLLSVADAVLEAVGDGFSATVRPILRGLAEPWGLALHPTDPDHLFVAEHAADRVLSVHRSTLRRLKVAAIKAPLEEGFPAPEAVAVDSHGRLFVITDDGRDGARELRSVHPGSGDKAEIFEIQTALVGPIGSIGIGADGFLLVPQGDRLAAGGGIEQARTIAAVDSQAAEITVDRDFDPGLAPSSLWRIPLVGDDLRTADSNLRRALTIDAHDALEEDPGGPLFVRLTPYDSERGTPDETDTPRALRPDLHVDARNVDGGQRSGSGSVSCDDFDRDGDLDLLSGSFDAGDVNLFEQRGPEFFVLVQSLDLPSDRGPIDVRFADIDGDDLLDSWVLVQDSTNGHRLEWYRGDGRQLGFRDSLALTFDAPYRIEDADFDGDGDSDLVLINRSGVVDFVDGLVLINGGAGDTFAERFPESAQASLEGLEQATSASIGDVDRDGLPDLVLTDNVGPSNVHLFLQDPVSGFPSQPDFSIDGGGQSPESGTLRDVDDDGDPDFAYVCPGSGDLRVLDHTSDGNQWFSDFPAYLLAALSTPFSVGAADVDRDWDLDLFFSEQLGNSLGLVLQRSRYEFSAAASLGSPETTPNPVRSLAADLNGDGAVDLIAANQVADELAILFQAAEGDFAQRPLLTVGNDSVTRKPETVIAADLDRDGDLDLASANDELNNLTVFLQKDFGFFSLPDFSLGNATDTAVPQEIAAGDIDGDGRLDLVSVNRGNTPPEGGVTIFLQTENGFEARPSVRLQDERMQRPQTLALADLNDDGRLDIVSGNGDSDNLVVLFQPAGGYRTTLDVDDADLFEIREPGLTKPVAVVASDIDLDEQVDLVAAYSTAVGLFRHQEVGGSHEWILQSRLGNGSTPSSAFVADINADGLPDIGSSTSRPSIAFFLQPQGGFQAGGQPDEELEDMRIASPRFATAMDIDADGRLDLFIADSATAQIVRFRQVCSLLFTLSPDDILGGPGTTDIPSSIALADLDSDGEIDLVTSNRGSNTLSVFYGGF